MTATEAPPGHVEAVHRALSTLDWWLDLAAAGYHLIPVTLRTRPDGKKDVWFHVDWQHEAAASIDPDQVKAWWVDNPDVSFAIDCGRSGIVVVDLDVEPGKDGMTWWSEQGHAISTMRGETRSGGLHLYFRADPDRPLRNTAGTIAPGVDTRAVGGCVFAPGSTVFDAGAVVGRYALLDPLLPVDQLPPTPELLYEDPAATRQRAWATDGRIVTHDREWMRQKADEQREQVRNWRPGDKSRGKLGFRYTLMGAAMFCGRLAEAGLSTVELVTDALLEDVAAVWGAPDEDDRMWIESGLADGPRKERWRVPDEEEDDTAEDVDSWAPVDVDAILDGTVEAPQPSVGASRADGVLMLYAGREHVAIGEMEAGKSWFALLHCAAEIMVGNRVIYVHFEETDPTGTVLRLVALGVPKATLRRSAGLFDFIAPERRVKPEDIHGLVSEGAAPTLVVLDGVNEAMALHGHDIMKPDGAAAYRRLIARPFKRFGATVLSLDHVVKDPGAKGNGYAAGSAHKMNGLDGAGFLLESIEAFSDGGRGATAVAVVKDRPGQLRKHGIADKRVPRKYRFAVLSLDSTSLVLDAQLHVVKEGETAGNLDDERAEAQEAQERAEYDQSVYEVVARLERGEHAKRGPSGRAVRSEVGGRPADVGYALERLRNAGRLAMIQRGSTQHWLTKGVAHDPVEQERREAQAQAEQKRAEKAARAEQERAEKAAQAEQERAEKAARAEQERAEKAARAEQDRAEVDALVLGEVKRLAQTPAHREHGPATAAIVAELPCFEKDVRASLHRLETAGRLAATKRASVTHWRVVQSGSQDQPQEGCWAAS